MFNITAKLVKKPITADRIMKYMTNGISAGLTKTAKEGQAAVIEKVKGGTFKNKTPWYNPSSPIGIRIKASTGETLRAEINTRAYFGPLQEKGGVKLPFSSTHLAMPARVGPLARMRRIPDDLRPKALIASGKGFLVTTERGTELLVVHNYRERGRYKGITVMYVLIKKANIKRTDFFEKPIQAVVSRNLAKNIDDAVRKSLGRLSERS